MDWKEVLESGDKKRKQLEDFAKEKKFNQADTYVALKLWVFALGQTEVRILKKPLEKVMELMIDSVKIKE